MSYEEPEELPVRPRRRVLEPIPVALLSVLMVACGFIGGVLVEKGQSSSSTTGLGGGGIAARLGALKSGASSAGAGAAGSSTGASGATGFFGRTGGFGRAAAGGGGGATVGQVSYMDGSTLYVADAEGNTVKVKTSAGSSVTKTVKTSVHGIHPGDTVIVQGTRGKGDAISATSISVSSGGSIGGGLGALFGSSQSASRGGLGGGGGTGPEGATGAGGGGGPALFGPG
jgi:hypothetical protein